MRQCSARCRVIFHFSFKPTYALNYRKWWAVPTLQMYKVELNGRIAH